MSELVEVSFYLVVCFHIKKYKLTSLHLLGIVPFFWHEQPKSMIKVKNMPCILGYSGLQRKRDVSWQKDIALEGPLNGQPQPIMCIWELTDSPGISLQSLRWVPFPTHGVLPWAPHTRLLICKPESSQADHSDQAIQPPKHRKEKKKLQSVGTQTNTRPHQTQDGPGSQCAHPSCHHPRPLTFPGSQTVQTHRKVFVM